MTSTQCAHCFVQIQHVEVIPCVAHCILHLTRTVSVTIVMTSTQCAHCFVQIQHVEQEPCLVVCPWCFAQAGLTLHKWVDFTLNACAHAVG